MHRSLATVPRTLRSAGTLDVTLRPRGDGFAVGHAYQAGCLRLRLPRAVDPRRPPEAVILNTAGGLAEGDTLDQRLAWAPATIGTVTTQAAEKVYRALADGARVATRLDVGAGASAEWLPQETIVFDGARLARDTRVVLGADVTFLGLEAIVLGRTARGERVVAGGLRDCLRIWRNDRLIYADTLDLEGDITATMARMAAADGARAMAVLVHASAGAAALIAPVRDVLGQARGMAAASAWNGLLAVRLLARDGAALRHDIALALAVLRAGRPLPRSWQC